MTDAEINKIVSSILRDRFKDLGFQRSTVRSEEDFDGSSILRIVVHLKNGDVPSNRLTDVLHEIRSRLISKGEERFVFLSSESPQGEMVDEDVE
ncbi:MAG: hypothetical protein AB7S93_15330 [Xanthobacteraceae bacterium]